MKLNILILQTVIVVIIMLFAVGIRMFGGDLYHKISNAYHSRFDDVTSVSEVIDPQNKTESTNSASNISTDVVFDDENSTFSTQNELIEEYDENIDGKVTGNITDFYSIDSKLVSSKYNSFLWPVYGTVSSQYGFRYHPISGDYLMHNGLDIAADKGTEIIAVYDGVVQKSGYSESYGYYVLLKHSNNLETLYAHCSSLNVETGDTVKRGETVAFVGSTGRSTGPHLHFEVRVKNYRIDPEWLLCERYDV
ncbi:MAG: M23 family metallopeptidase [Clostridia bacterium]|nr:M23 family metallopeptidase [Clostridia bacterium]